MIHDLTQAMSNNQTSKSILSNKPHCPDDASELTESVDIASIDVSTTIGPSLGGTLTLLFAVNNKL